MEHLRERWPQVRTIPAAANLGFAGGNNLGIREARGDHIALLNNDTGARPGWLAALLAAMESGERVGAVTSKLVYLDRPGVIQNAGGLLLSDGSGADRGCGQPDDGRFDSCEEVFSACGCAVLLNRAMLDDVGPLDSTFFMYYEDTDLSWRMRLRGWRVLYQPAALVEHLHAGTSREWSPFFTFHVDRNRLFMIVKNAPPAFVVRAFARLAWLSVRFLGRAVLPWPRRGGGAAPARQSVPGAQRALIHGRVLGSLVVHLPEMLAKRRRIRRSRIVSDAKVLQWAVARKQWDTGSG